MAPSRTSPPRAMVPGAVSMDLLASRLRHLCPTVLPTGDPPAPPRAPQPCHRKTPREDLGGVVLRLVMRRPLQVLRIPRRTGTLVASSDLQRPSMANVREVGLAA